MFAVLIGTYLIRDQGLDLGTFPRALFGTHYGFMGRTERENILDYTSFIQETRFRPLEKKSSLSSFFEKFSTRVGDFFTFYFLYEGLHYSML